MNIEQAKAISIAEILGKVDRQPVRESETDAWYFSPRGESTPSLHVNKKENVWFDHGEGKGGNAFDLVVQILKWSGYSFDPQDALRWLRNTNLDPSLLKPRDPVKNKQSKWKLLNIIDLEDLALIRYLERRGINVEIARKYVCEIYIRKRCSLTKMFAIGFENEEGGFEGRNKYVKTCVAPKTISFIRADKPKPDCVMVFEGFMDFLTYVTVKKGEVPQDCIILNSVACVDHAIRYIKNYGYKICYTWMDNDKAGDAAQKRLNDFIATEPGLTHRPLNYLYKDHKDLNDWYTSQRGLKPTR